MLGEEFFIDKISSYGRGEIKRRQKEGRARKGTRASDHIKIEVRSYKGDRIKTHVMFNPLLFFFCFHLGASRFFLPKVLQFLSIFESQHKHTKIQNSTVFLFFSFLFCFLVEVGSYVTSLLSGFFRSVRMTYHTSERSFRWIMRKGKNTWILSYT